MSTSPEVKPASSTGVQPILVIPQEGSKNPLWLLTLGVAGLVLGGGFLAWNKGLHADQFFKPTVDRLAYLTIDRGEIAVFINESGSLDTGIDPPIKCQVEALLGTVGGAAMGGVGGGGGGGVGGGGGGAGGNRRGGAGGMAKGGGGAAGGGGMTKTKAGGRGKVSAKGKSSAANANAGGASAASAKGAAGGGAAAAASGDGTAVATKKPSIRSFSYQVAPHNPLRGASQAAMTNAQTAGGGRGGMSGGGAGGGGGRGGRGGGGGGMGGDEKSGSTRIIRIVDEGTRVKGGEIVCELDSSAFRDELAAQEIKVAQARAWLEQSKTLVEVNGITQAEYRDGIYPQDLGLIRQYIMSCELEADRAQKTSVWSREMRDAKLRTTLQYESDVATLDSAELNLRGAERMYERLEKYTHNRLIKTLESKLEASRADMFAQELAVQREEDRLKRLNRMVDFCTIRAPRDGVVVYYVQSNGWGRNEARIQEGVTVREGQPIFTLPDPKNLRVKAKINESRISFVESGMPVTIKIDAFPDRPLTGKVAEIVPIPTPGGGPMSDTKAYSAVVTIENGFDELRPGLSAEVMMHVKSHEDVVRIPVEAVRWVGMKTYAAITPDRGITWSWQPLKLGLVNENYAEVLKGLKSGDNVIAVPDKFTNPKESNPLVPTAPATVEAD